MNALINEWLIELMNEWWNERIHEPVRLRSPRDRHISQNSPNSLITHKNLIKLQQREAIIV